MRKSARTRDPDLSRRDRVELTIDTNRDYRTAFKFVIDHRGWVNESCAGSQGWDPEWYVAQSEDDSTWTVEVAIPLEQIAAHEPDQNTTWAMALKRKIFDDHNVWKSESKSGQSSPDEFQVSGLQFGLTANPVDFELVRFVDQQQVPESQAVGANVRASFDETNLEAWSIPKTPDVSPEDSISSVPNEFRRR